MARVGRFGGQTGDYASVSCFDFDARISVIVVSWNAQSRIDACLSSVESCLPCAEVIVVDNGSRDGTVDMITASHPDVQVARNAENVGFATANNQGAALASRDYLLFLNDDAEILNADWMKVANQWRSASEFDVFGFRLVGTDSRPYSSAYQLPRLTEFILSLFWLPGSGHRLVASLFPPALADLNSAEPQQVQGVEGSAFLMMRRVFIVMGGFDQAFTPAYSEDVDFFQRMARRGAQVFWVPFVTVIHSGGTSSGGTASYRRRKNVFAKAVQYHVKWSGVPARITLAAGCIVSCGWNSCYAAVRMLSRRKPGEATETWNEWRTRLSLSLMGIRLAWSKFPPEQLGFHVAA